MIEPIDGESGNLEKFAFPKQHATAQRMGPFFNRHLAASIRFSDRLLDFRYTQMTEVTSGISWRRVRSIPMVSVISLEGQPTQAP